MPGLDISFWRTRDSNKSYDRDLMNLSVIMINHNDGSRKFFQAINHIIGSWELFLAYSWSYQIVLPGLVESF